MEIGSGHFSMVELDDPLQYNYRHNGNTILVEHENVNLSIYRDGKWTKNYKTPISKQKYGKWKSYVTVNLNEFLTKAEKAKLKKGKKIRMAFDYSKIGTERITTLTRHSKTYSKQYHGGAFRVFYDVEIRNKKLVLKRQR
jgi:hypothetical protein